VAYAGEAGSLKANHVKPAAGCDAFAQSIRPTGKRKQLPFAEQVVGVPANLNFCLIALI